MIREMSGMKKINVVLDIDDTIATGFDRSDMESYQLENPWLSLFQKENLYVEAFRPHIIHPGVVEFIQILDKMPHVKIHFFSAGISERNTILVEKLLIRSLGEQRYTEIKDTVTICSREHLESSNKEWINEKLDSQRKVFGINFGSFKKNLLNVLAPEDDIQWAVLIEDDHTYSMPGQEKNLLTLIRATDYDFSGFYRKRLDTTDEPIGIKNDRFFRVNHVFGYAGVFLTALENTQKNNTTLSEEIFKIHFIKNTEPNPSSELIMDYSVRTNLYYYELGLKHLKTVSPHINFWTGL